MSERPEPTGARRRCGHDAHVNLFISRFGACTWRVFNLLIARIVVSRESTRRLLIASLAGAFVAVFAVLLLALLLSRVSAARDFNGSLVTQSPSDKSNGAKLRAVALAKKVQVNNETCERHCARKRGEFGCLLGASSAIGASATRPKTRAERRRVSLSAHRPSVRPEGPLSQRFRRVARYVRTLERVHQMSLIKLHVRHWSRLASNGRLPSVFHSEDGALRRSR